MINSKDTGIFVDDDNGRKCYVNFIIETKIRPTFIRESIASIKKEKTTK